MTGRTAAALLRLADLILSGTIRMPRGRGARVAALLTRTALEEIVDGLCRSNGLDVPQASMRVKLACLRAVSADGASDAALAWRGLSRACHQHAYEIAPSHLEVAHLAATVLARGGRGHSRGAGIRLDRDRWFGLVWGERTELS